MLLLLCVVVVLTNLHSGVAQTLVNHGVLSQTAVVAAQKAILTMNADDTCYFYWNGELVERPNTWTDVTIYELVPVPINNYPNILAINVTDFGAYAGLILQLEYAGETYKMGSSPEIQIAKAYSDDPSWYISPQSDPDNWSTSDTHESCKMTEAEEKIRQDFYKPGTFWRWSKKCGNLNTSIFVKLVVHTKLDPCCE